MASFSRVIDSAGLALPIKRKRKQQNQQEERTDLL
jgi:hypothetical protein